MNNVLTVSPASEPVTVDELKTWLRMDSTQTSEDNDTQLDGLLTAAREQVETDTHRVLVTQTWKQYLDAFPFTWSGLNAHGKRMRRHSHIKRDHYNAIEILRNPVQSVTSIKYVDGAGATQTLDPSLYTVDVISAPARIVPVNSWPSTKNVPNAVEIEYIAGYGDPEGSPVVEIPERLRTAILYKAALLYEPVAGEEADAADRAYNRMLSSFVVHLFAR